MSRTRVLVLAGAVLGAALFVPTGADAGPQPKPKPEQQQGQGINFTSPCKYSHRAKDDPIVFPAQPGASHSHDFIANTSTNALSTYQTLQASGTNCLRTDDTAAYWVPTLYKNGKPVSPSGSTVYYLPAGKKLESIKPFPAGLKVVAGDAKATSPQSLQVARWACTGQDQMKPASAPQNCPEKSQIVLVVRFPDCWNGKTLDSTDHKSHLAYSKRGTCPSTHPVAVPLLGLHVRYPVRNASGLSLASGSIYSAHADFFNAWNQKQLTFLCQQCLNKGVHCGRGNPPGTAPD